MSVDLNSTCKGETVFKKFPGFDDAIIDSVKIGRMYEEKVHIRSC